MPKQVMLSDDAYRVLAAAKGPGESFSDVVLRTYGERERRLREFRRWVHDFLPDPELADSIERARKEHRLKYPEERRR